jgi:hypothetical protein
MLCYSNTCANNGLIMLNKFVLRIIKTCVIYFIINIKHSHVTLVIRGHAHTLARCGCGCAAAFFFGQSSKLCLGMKTDRIRTDITDIVFVFIFMSGFGFKYG